MPRVQDALPSLDCRAWKGRSNPLLLSALRFAPESRAGLSLGRVRVDITSLRAEMGDPTARWISQELPGALAQALASVGRAGASAVSLYDPLEELQRGSLVPLCDDHCLQDLPFWATQFRPSCLEAPAAKFRFQSCSWCRVPLATGFRPYVNPMRRPRSGWSRRAAAGRQWRRCGTI